LSRVRKREKRLHGQAGGSSLKQKPGDHLFHGGKRRKCHPLRKGRFVHLDEKKKERRGYKSRKEKRLI